MASFELWLVDDGVVAGGDVVQQGGVCGLPVEALAGERVGGGCVGAEEPAQPSEVGLGVFRSDRNGRHTEGMGVCLGDVLGGYTFLGYGMHTGTRLGAFQDKAYQMCGVQPVDSWPSIGTVTDVAADARACG